MCRKFFELVSSIKNPVLIGYNSSSNIFSLVGNVGFDLPWIVERSRSDLNLVITKFDNKEFTVKGRQTYRILEYPQIIIADMQQMII